MDLRRRPAGQSLAGCAAPELAILRRLTVKPGSRDAHTRQARIRGGGKAIVLTLRGDGMPTEAERGTATGWRAWRSASVATTATLPEPAFCMSRVMSGRQRQPAVTRGGTGASHLLGWSNGLIADIAVGHDLH